MTAELTRTGRTVFDDVDPQQADRLRHSRLERLRASRAGIAQLQPQVLPPTLPGSRTERAERLAVDLGGKVVETPQRAIVVVESSELLPPDLDGLSELPDPICPGAPLVLIDTETTGLGTGTGTLPFVIGVGSWQGERFVTRQLVLPEQSDEPGFLAYLATLVPADAWLVTYNGRTFDWPLLVTRFRLHGRPAPVHAGHLDLLPLARTLWRHRLADARLASVEREVCGVRRAHDLPGGLVPARYLDYLRSGHGGLLRLVLEHNRQDVVSMALLLLVLARDLAPVARTRRSPGSVHPGDLGGLGRAFARRRRNEEALACFEAALERIVDAWDGSTYESIAIDRARLLTRLGQRVDAEGAWEAIAMEGGRNAALAWVQVAKHREHDARDYPAALAATDRARALVERSRVFGRRDRLVERDLARRVPRLHRLLAAAAA